MDDLSYPVERRFYGDDESQFVDISRPSDVSHGVVLSLHGGYWRDTYGLDLHDPIVEHCVKLGWTVVNAEYRRIVPGEQSVWHDMSSDVQQAAIIARDIAGNTPLVALGHSAGGHLALWVAGNFESSFEEIPIDAVVGLAAVTDLVAADRQQLSNGATRELFGLSADEDLDLYELASPYHVLPLGLPQLIIHGPNDAHVPYEMAVNYVDSARALGDEVTFVNDEGIDHFNVIDPSHRLWRHIDAFLEAQRPY